MSFRRHIPNLFTIGNLLCGSIAIVLVLQHGYDTWGVLLIFLAAILDVFDGAVARALGVSNPIGKELDSLADVVSFGLSPSVIAYLMLEQTLADDMQWLKYIAFLNVICAALRLAKFNISTDQTHDFSGMPSPANGILWGSIAATVWETNNSFLFNENAWVILAMVFLSSLLMVSRMRMFSFKFKNGGFAANRIPYLFIGSVLLFPAISWMGWHSLFFCVALGLVWYIMFSAWYHLQADK